MLPSGERLDRSKFRQLGLCKDQSPHLLAGPVSTNDTRLQRTARGCYRQSNDNEGDQHLDQREAGRSGSPNHGQDQFCW